MKRLLLLRHAKSSWDDANLSDFERPLNSRGLVTAPFMGELIASREIEIDMIVSSPATRAAETAMLVKENGGLNAELRFDERIYEASPQSLLLVTSEFDNSFKNIMLVGHNPGIEGFIGFLTGTIQPMPTAALAIIELDIKKWKDLASGSGIVETVLRPKDLIQY